MASTVSSLKLSLLFTKKCPFHWNGIYIVRCHVNNYYDINVTIYSILSILKTSKCFSHEDSSQTILCFKMEDVVTLVLHFCGFKLKKTLFQEKLNNLF